MAEPAHCAGLLLTAFLLCKRSSFFQTVEGLPAGMPKQYTLFARRLSPACDPCMTHAYLSPRSASSYLTVCFGAQAWESLGTGTFVIDGGRVSAWCAQMGPILTGSIRYSVSGAAALAFLCTAKSSSPELVYSGLVGGTTHHAKGFPASSLPRVFGMEQRLVVVVKVCMPE